MDLLDPDEAALWAAKLDEVDPALARSVRGLFEAPGAEEDSEARVHAFALGLQSGFAIQAALDAQRLRRAVSVASKERSPAAAWRAFCAHVEREAKENLAALTARTNPPLRDDNH